MPFSRRPTFTKVYTCMPLPQFRGGSLSASVDGRRARLPQR